jgi:diadenosine tetraphosphatase ApaH/serine/threonine PP2A family protein phosphatase
MSEGAPRALLYDVHANLPALEAVIADATGAGATAFVLGGDYAFAGAWPSETVARLRELDAVWIRGNGERWTASPQDAPNDAFVSRALAWCHEQLGEPVVGELAQLPESLEREGVSFCHGSPRSDVETFFPQPAPGEEELLAGVTAPVLVFGHSHLQFQRRTDGRLLVNPGSVGMPLDGDRRAAYALWHGGDELEPRRVEYDHERYLTDVRERMGAALGETIGTLLGRLQDAAMK